MKYSKVAVSLPRALFDEVERERKKLGVGRSLAVQEGLKAWVRLSQEAERARRYVEAWRRKPETARELALSDAIVTANWPRR